MKKSNKSIGVVIILSLITTFIILSNSYAGTHIFTVLISKGDISKVEKNKNEKLNIDSKLDKNDIIIAEGDVYLCLVTKDGAFIEINKPGKYLINDLKEKVIKVDSNILVSYIDFLKESLNQKTKKTSSYIGGRERGYSNTEIEALMPKTTKIFHNDLSLSWNKNSIVKDYILTIKDENNNIILTKQLSDTTYKFDISELNWERNKCYYWNVSDAKSTVSESESYCIYYVSEEDVALIKEKVKKYSDSELSIFESLIVAKFFESNGFIYDANNWYYKTYWNNKDIKELENLYYNFLIINSTK